MATRVEFGSGPFHMAADLALLAQAEDGVSGWRVYTWDGLWVSLGKSQRVSDVLLSSATPWVSRPTGGAAVLHGHDVTVSVALPISRASKSVYPTVTLPLIQALGELGVSVFFAGQEFAKGRYAKEPDCFATVTKNDLVDRTTGEKLCGCALRRTRSAVLMQASIPVGQPLVAPESVLIGGVRSAATHVDASRLYEELEKALAAMQ